MESNTDTITYRVPDAARRIGVSDRELESMLARGEIESIRQGRRRLIPRSALEAWLARKLQEEAAS